MRKLVLSMAVSLDGLVGPRERAAGGWNVRSEHDAGAGRVIEMTRTVDLLG